MKLIYIAGAYSARHTELVELNIKTAQYYAVRICQLKQGWFPIIPHKNTERMDEWLPHLTQDWWREGTLELMKRCDAVIIITGSEHSIGTKNEEATALELNIPVYKSIEEIPCQIQT